ncbi:MAG: PAS domain-containing sensor histidine kinase [Calditrichaeota bacterium]|nr:MAG: PAS domain-containing sensor histidine kinase [Calditrichota bacterium]
MERNGSMKSRSNFFQYFQELVRRLKTVEESAELFTELSNISQEMSQLEALIRTSFATLDNQFDAFLVQLDVLSEIIDFYRTLARTKSREQAWNLIREFLERQIPHDDGLICIRLSNLDPEFTYLPETPEKEPYYREKLGEAELMSILEYFRNRDMAVALNNVRQFQITQVPWEVFEAHSLMLFPLIVRGNLIGFGALVRKEKPFMPQEQSVLNLLSPPIALSLYQQFYLEKLKGRLFKQFKTKRLLADVKYAEYFDGGPVLIFAVDPRGVILHANATALKSLGVDEDYLLGEKFVHLLPPEQRESFVQTYRTLEENQRRRFRSRFQRASGETLILDLYLTKVELKNRFSLILVFGVDVTDQVAADSQARQTELLDEITHFSRQAYGFLNELVQHLVPNLSYLKNQLQDNPQLINRISAMEKYLAQAEQVVKRFLSFNLPEPAAPQKVDINREIKAFVEKLNARYGERVEVLHALEPGLPPLEAHPEAVKRLLGILTRNALEALGDRKGYIHISTRSVQQKEDGLRVGSGVFLEKGRYIEMVFEDNGPGIDARHVQNIFKPFYTTKVENQGYGLGLFFAYNLLKQMGGSIVLRSDEGQGTRVFCYFPIRGASALARQKTTAETKTQNGKQKAVLVVDDEYNIRSVISEVLEMNGLRVYTAANGQEALQIFKKHAEEIGLVILDMIMPVMDGRRTFAEIRRIKPAQKIIIISGYAHKEDLQDVLSAGALAFLSKPFQVKDILQRVKQALN